MKSCTRNKCIAAGVAGALVVGSLALIAACCRKKNKCRLLLCDHSHNPKPEEPAEPEGRF